MTEIAEIARKALEILDRDGWNKGTLTHPDTGSHCIGGAWNLALSGEQYSDWRDDESVQQLARIIREQFPGRSLEGTSPFRLRLTIATWNNHPETTEAEVRSILEKLAAG